MATEEKIPTTPVTEPAAMASSEPKAEVTPEATTTPEIKKPEVDVAPEKTDESNTKKLFPKLTHLSPTNLFHSKKPTPIPETETKVSPETQQITNEVLMRMIDEKLKVMNSDDFLVIKLSKKGLLLVVGLLLALIWTFPLIEMGVKQIKTGIRMPSWSLPFMKKPVESPSPQISPEVTPAPVPDTENRIRIRTGNISKDINDYVINVLTQGGFSKVEMINDPQVISNQVMVASQLKDAELKQKLTELLASKFEVSSESATLSEDSDFAATILIGKNVKPKN